MLNRRLWKKALICLLVVLEIFVQTFTVIAEDGQLKESNRAELFRQLDMVFQDPSYKDLISNNDGRFFVGNPINAYEFVKGTIKKMNFSLYPLFFIVRSYYDNGEIHVNLTDSYVNELSQFIDENIALLYDSKQCYVVSSSSSHAIGEFSSRIKSRDTVSNTNKDKVLQSGEFVFSRLSSNTILDYNIHSNSNGKSSATLIVSYVSQNPPSNICWAASVACIGNYLTSYSYSAQHVAIAVYGSTNWNQSNTLYGALSALSSIYGVTYGKYSSNTAPTDSRIYNNISGGYPLYTRWQFSGGVHATVIQGITTGSHVYVMDPEYGFSVANKVSGKYKYVSAYSGVTLTLIGYGAKLS